MRTLPVFLLLVSSLASAQQRGGHRQVDVVEVVADAYRQVLQREPDQTPEAHRAYWEPRLRGLSRRAAFGVVSRELYASEEYRCLRYGCAMNAGAFDGFLSALSAAAFSSDRLGMIESVGAANRFEVAQLKRVLGVLPFSGERVRALEVLGPRVLDKGNVWMLDDALPFAGERERARALLR